MEGAIVLAVNQGIKTLRQDRRNYHGTGPFTRVAAPSQGYRRIAITDLGSQYLHVAEARGAVAELDLKTRIFSVKSTRDIPGALEWHILLINRQSESQARDGLLKGLTGRDSTVAQKDNLKFLHYLTFNSR
ncbi:MAG: hypothetical protein P8079_10975 [Gammaproteobacteria bacterium]